MKMYTYYVRIYKKYYKYVDKETDTRDRLLSSSALQLPEFVSKYDILR